jgi:hypothetical protein
MAWNVETESANPLEEWLVSQPSYGLNEGSEESIVLLTELEKSNAAPSFYFHGEVAPKQYLSSGVAALTSVADEFNLPPGTVIWGVGGWSSQALGFKLQLFEAGTKQYWYQRTYGNMPTVTGSLVNGANADVPPQNIFTFSEPYYVTPPGNLVIQITNLANVLAYVQVFLACACPLGGKIVGVPRIGRWN